MNKSESISKLSMALHLAQQDMGQAKKDSTNPFFKSKYADLNSVREAAMPALNKQGIVVLQPTVWLDGKSFVETVLLHNSGEFLSGLTEIRTPKENDAQSMGAGISYARRYGLQSILSIGAEDDDAQSIADRSGPTLINTHKEAAAKVFSTETIGTKFIIPIGKNKGKTLDQLQKKDIENFVNWAREQSDLKGAALTTLTEMENFLSKDPS